MKKGTGFSQNEQKVEGPQTNIGKDAIGPILSGTFNDQVNIISGAELPPPPIPHQIPSPPLDFTGRDDELKDLIAQFDRGGIITGLRGMGGIGKTALALVLAEKLKGRFGDGQVFLKLNGTNSNPLKPSDAMAQVIRAFRGSAERLPEDQDELQSLYYSVLEDKNILLLLDNADDRKQVQPLLPPKGCAVIITSRKKFTLPGMPEPFLLDTLKPSDARDLLLRICPRIGCQADELAELCGYLPLALRASASLLAVKSDLNTESYLEELRSERTRIEMIGKEGVDLDVEASFNLSYSRLSAKMASVFCKLSVFPSDFDATAEEEICQDQRHMQLSDLVTWSLVEFDEGADRYHLHDLTRIFAASRLETATKTEVQQRHAKHYENVLSSATQLYIKGKQLAALRKFDAEWTNIQTGWIWAKQSYEADNQAVSLCSAYLNWPFLLDLRLYAKERILWLETGLAASRKQGNRSMEGVHLGNLGQAYAVLGDAKKAIEFYERALVIFREIRDRRGEGTALSNLSNVYIDLGDAKKAIEFYEQRLIIAREIRDRRGEGAALGNLGIAYDDLSDAKKAIKFYEQHLVIAREIGDQRGEGNALWNMSLSLDKLGQRAEAIDNAMLALKIFEQIENPTAARVRQRLAEWQNESK